MRMRHCLGLLMGITGALWALDPKAMVGDPPTGLSAYERGAVLRHGVKGTLFFNCDDSCVVAVNGKVIGTANGRAVQKEKLTLRPGDVLCVEARNTGMQDGLALAFVSTDGNTTIVAKPEDWREYVPPVAKKWAETADVAEESLKRCRRGSNQGWKGRVEAASDAICPSAVWGSSGGTTTYLLHVVTYADLAAPGKK